MNRYTKILETRIGFWREFAIGVAIAVAARGSMLFPLNYSEDTYRFLNYPEGADFALFASEMRAFGYPLIKFLDAIGAHYPYAGALWPILFTAAFVYAGLISMRIWLPNAGSLIFVVGACLFALFPYQSDYLSFHNAAPSFTIMLLLGWSALLIAPRSRSTILLSLPALAYVVSGQILFGFLFLVVFIEAMIWAYAWCLQPIFSRSGIWSSAKPWAIRLALLFSGAIFYVVASRFIMLVTGVASGSRLEMSGMADYPEKMVLYAKQSYYFLCKGEVSVPFVLKLLQLTLLGAIGFAGLFALFTKQAFGFPRLIIWLLLAGATTLGVGACMGVMLPIKNAYELMNPRTLSALSVYWAGVFAIAMFVASGRGKLLVLVLGAFLAFGYGVNANRQALDHARINERDRLVASRMVERLCQLPQFDSVRTVVLVGAQHAFNLDRVSTSTGGFNVSSLYRPWSSTAVLREVSGIPFEYPTDADRELAERAAIGKPEWPAPGSVFIEGDVGVVVLPKGEK
jgi:hypothetical protein